MTELEQYLAEEVAEDLEDGIITRREAMRRLGLMGLSAAAATAMLSQEAAHARASRGGGHGGHDRGDGKQTTWATVATTPVTFPGPNGTLMGAWAPATKPRGGVLVIHENRGLTDHIRNVAGRWAASGWSALALDLLSEEGGTGAFPGEAEVAAKLSEISASNPGRFDKDMRAAVTELDKRVPRNSPLGATGFCFGGGMIWRLLAAGEKRLAAAAPFYGPFPTGGNLRDSRAAVLAIYAAADTRVNDTREAARLALEAARLRYELLTFANTNTAGETVNHAFFNDTGARFNPMAAEEAWRRVVSWFDDADDHRGHR
jgi:carboxymethylenebutenolidase